MKRITIRKQRYKCYDGSRPLSWAIYINGEFACYSWSYEGVLAVLAYLKEQWA